MEWDVEEEEEVLYGLSGRKADSFHFYFSAKSRVDFRPRNLVWNSAGKQNRCVFTCTCRDFVPIQICHLSQPALSTRYCHFDPAWNRGRCACISNSIKDPPSVQDPAAYVFFCHQHNVPTRPFLPLRSAAKNFITIPEVLNK